MCGRTSLFVPPSVLEDRFDAPDEITTVEWGLLPSWIDDPANSPKPINAWAETVAEKPMFRDAFDNRRCLVLADLAD